MKHVNIIGIIIGLLLVVGNTVAAEEYPNYQKIFEGNFMSQLQHVKKSAAEVARSVQSELEYGEKSFWLMQLYNEMWDMEISKRIGVIYIWIACADAYVEATKKHMQTLSRRDAYERKKVLKGLNILRTSTHDRFMSMAPDAEWKAILQGAIDEQARYLAK